MAVWVPGRRTRAASPGSSKLRHPAGSSGAAVCRRNSGACEFWSLCRLTRPRVSPASGWFSGLAAQAGQKVDDFVEALLQRVAESDVRFDRGVPVFRPRSGAPILTVEDVDRITRSDEA